MKFFRNVECVYPVFLILLLGNIIFNALSTSAGCPQECRDESSFLLLIGRNNSKADKCIRWDQGKYSNEIKNPQILSTTFCKKGDTDHFWCSTTNGWSYCEYPTCKYYSTGCVQHWSATNYSVTIPLTHFVPSRDYLIVAYDESFECLLHKYCISSCGMVDHYVSDFFKLCQTEHSNQTATNIVFHSLKHNSTYQIYVIPISDAAHVTDLTLIMAKTRMARPSIPLDIKTKPRSTTALEILWKKPVNNGTFGDASDYLVTIDDDVKNSKLTTNENVVINGLNPLQKYCVFVEARNGAGKSDPSEKSCFIIKSLDSNVQFYNIKNQSTSKMNISWIYESHSFNVEFIVKHKQKNAVKWSTQTSSKRFLNLYGLVRNRIYTVSVQAMIKPGNDVADVYGNENETTFYTGKDTIELENMTSSITHNNFAISWKISQDDLDAVLSIIVNVEDIQDQCRLIGVFKKMEYFVEEKEHGKALDSFISKTLAKCFPIYEYNLIWHGHEFSHSWPINSTFNLIKYQIFVQTRIGIRNVAQGDMQANDSAKHHWKAMEFFWLLLALPVICVAVAAVVVVRLNMSKLRKFWKCKKRPRVQRPSPPATPKVATCRLNRPNNNEYAKRSMHFDNQDNHAIPVKDFLEIYQSLQKDKIMNEFKELTKKQLISGNMLNEKCRDLSLDVMKDKTALQIEEFITVIDPTKDTQMKFWKEIWKKKVSIIVMLSCTDCFPYWSYTGMGRDKLKVVVIKEKPGNEIFQRKILLLNNESGENRTIYHFQLLSWIDNKSPPLNDLKEIRKLFRCCGKKRGNPPYLVHSKKDSGRTGFFMCLDDIIENLVDNSEHINIFGTVFKFSEYPHCKIVDCMQYPFLYEFVNEYLSNREQTLLDSPGASIQDEIYEDYEGYDE